MTKNNIYTTITNSIIECIESGVLPWLRPWKDIDKLHSIPIPLRHNGQKYSGMNVILLWMIAHRTGYISPYWMTFKQAKSYGAYVQKGEKSHHVVYANKFTKKETDTESNEDADNTATKSIFYLKTYRVFNAEQISGLKDHFYSLEAQRHNEDACLSVIQNLLTKLGIDIRHGGNRAYYSYTHDYIRIPRLEAFDTALDYTATIAHELLHWTRHPTRLDRSYNSKKFGDQNYAFEELIAEIGAAFLCAHLGLSTKVENNHAPYVANWLQALKNDNRFIFQAVSQAQKAVNYLLQQGEADTINI